MIKRVIKKKGKMRIGSVFNKKKILLTLNVGNAISKFYPDSLRHRENMMIKEILIVFFNLNKSKHSLEKLMYCKNPCYKQNYNYFEGIVVINAGGIHEIRTGY